MASRISVRWPSFGDQRQRQRRGGSILAGLDGEPVGVGADDGEDDTARGEHPDVGEVGEGAREREEHPQREERLEQRHGHQAEAPPRALRFQEGALEQLGRDGVDAGQEQHGDEGAAAPDVEQDDADKGPGATAEDAVDAGFHMSHERGVGGVGRGVQGPVPPDHAHARGIRPGEEDGQEDEDPAPERPGQQQGEAEPERQLRHARDGRVGDGDGGRPPELGVSELPAIVLQPDERRGSLLERREAGEARPDLPAKGVGQHGEKQEGGRGQEEIGGPEFALPPCPPSDHRGHGAVPGFSAGRQERRPARWDTRRRGGRAGSER